MQRHPDKARAADGVLDYPELAGRLVAIGHDGRRIVEIQSKRHVVVGSIEARSVGDVEDVQAVLEVDALRDGRVLEDGEVGALLEWPAEQVAAAVAECRLKGVAGLADGIAGRDSILP